MKKLLIIAIVAMFAAGSFGQMLAAGTSELKVEGQLDFETADDTLFALEVFYGLFFFDYTEFGGFFGIVESDSVSIWKIGVAGEHNFDLGTELVPYVGVGLAYANYEIEHGEQTEDDNALILSGSVGAKYFIAENIAVSAALVLEYASEDIFDTEDDFDDTNASLELGMRFFF